MSNYISEEELQIDEDYTDLEDIIDIIFNVLNDIKEHEKEIYGDSYISKLNEEELYDLCIENKIENEGNVINKCYMIVKKEESNENGYYLLDEDIEDNNNE